MFDQKTDTKRRPFTAGIEWWLEHPEILEKGSIPFSSRVANALRTSKYAMKLKFRLLSEIYEESPIVPVDRVTSSSVAAAPQFPTISAVQAVRAPYYKFTFLQTYLWGSSL